MPRDLKAADVGIAGLPKDVSLWWKDFEEATYETLKPIPTICPYRHDDLSKSRLVYVGKIRTYK